MGIYAESNSSNYKQMEPGVYPAICQMMVQIGTVPNPFHRPDDSESKEMRHEVFLRWEFPTETHVFSESRGPEPYTIGRTFTLSMHEKAGLRKLLESWRGKAFNDEEAKRFDISKLLGKPCQINVVSREKNGKTYSEIGSISPLMKGSKAPDPINPQIMLSFEDWDEGIYQSLPDWLKKRIAESEEYKAMHGEVIAPPPPASDDDDLPF